MSRVRVSIGLGMSPPASLLTVCTAPQTRTEKGAVHGIAGGAAAGALLGQVIAHDTKATPIGAALGGLGGAGVGKMMNNQERDVRAALASSEAAAVTREGNLLAVTFKRRRDVRYGFRRGQAGASL